MMIFQSFADELVKIAAPGLPPELRAAAQLTAPAKDWSQFEKDLKNPQVRESLRSATTSAKTKSQIDPKLRKYIQNVGDYIGQKEYVAEVQSKTNPKKFYKIKELPSGRLACGCADWQYVRSVGNSDCAHIRALKSSQEKT